MNHTPTPWAADGVFILSTNDRHVIDTLLIAKTVTSDMQHGSFDITDTETAGANAAHIVKCVNAHDELVAALKRAERALEHGAIVPGDLLVVRASLAKAC